MVDVLFALDLSWFAHRAWGSALAAVSRGRGYPGESKGVYGMARNSLAESLRRVQEELAEHERLGDRTRLVAALDSGFTWRHAAFAAYKGKRDKPGPWKARFLDEAHLQFDGGGVELYDAGGWYGEADDALATLARRASDAGWEVRVVTADHDLFQIVDDRVRVSCPRKDKRGYELLGPAGVLERAGVPPAKIPLYKAIAGDASDNIPGIPGLGPVAATRLASRYASLEDIYADLAHLAPSERQRIEAARRAEFTPDLFLDLCTLRTDLPLRRIAVEQAVAA